jgi:hypothetical protein
MPVLALLCFSLSAQVTLSGTSHSENFDALPGGLPTGFTVRTGATGTALGTVATFNTSAISWSSTTGQFANFASADIGAGSSTAAQAAATDRALGVRQTGTVGDPGAAFVFQVDNTSGRNSFVLDFKLQSLDVASTRTVTWRVDYAVGASPAAFTNVAATGSVTTGATTFSNNSVHIDFGDALDNIADIVTIRIVTVTASTGSGNRPTSAIDDFTLAWVNAGGPATPTITINTTSLAFPTTEINSSSAALTYQLSAADLTEDVAVSTAAPYTVSTDDINYSTSITIDRADAALVSGKTIYVKFSPAIAGAAPGTISNLSTGATPKVVGLTGSGISFIHLTASPFTETFDNIGVRLPDGVSVRVGATGTASGNPGTFSVNKTNWASTAGGFFNYASGDIGTSEPQTSATDRALGLRQTGTVGDPGGAFFFQVANTTGKINFSLDFSLQSLDANSTRTVNWRVDYGFGENPSTFTMPVATGTLSTGGQSFTNNPIHIDFGNALDNQGSVITIRIVTLTASTGSGNRPTTGIDDFTLTWEDPNAKTISISANAISFPATGIAGNSTQTYTIVKQTNLDNPVVVTATAPYTVSTDNVSFSSSLSVVPADAFNKTIYVRFAPATGGVFNGTVTNASEGAVSKIITLSGEGIDPSNLRFDFNSCSPSGGPGSGFLSINTTGSQKWACTPFGRNGTSGVSVNGFSGGSPQTNEAWLISAPLQLAGIVNKPVLSFYSRAEFSGPVLQLYVSTDYDGSGSPATATWTEITNANFPTPPGGPTSIWTLSDNIDLSAYKSSPKVFIAWKYTSSTALNAARWSIDDVMITDQSSLVTVGPLELNFGEVSVGSNAAGQAVSLTAAGNTNITITPPAGYQLSSNNTSFSSSPLVIPQAIAAAGTNFYVRFSPTEKALKITGTLNFSAPGLNRDYVSLSGSSYPRAETFDVACYNLAFFGNNSTNSATPGKITLQINNITTVLQRINMDVIGVEEISSDSAMNVLVSQLPGYAAVLSERYSHSFDPPDPTFPPQKVGVIYNTATMTLSTTEPPRAMFESMFDSARLNLPGHRLTDYPTGSPSSFWSSGRLPFLATFDVNINGQMKKVRIIVLHAKAIGDAESFTRRKYDAQVLKDSIDAYYRNDNVIIVGDYNDRLISSTYTGSPISPYQPFVLDTAGYTALTRSLDSAGRVSFISGSGLIDHILITNPLRAAYIAHSTDIEDPRQYIASYNDSTASDHLPVYTRFSFAPPPPPPPPAGITTFTGQVRALDVLLSWTTSREENMDYFIVERSPNGTDFTGIGLIDAKGNSTTPTNYKFSDYNPMGGTTYYRLIMVDEDGDTARSAVVSVTIKGSRPPYMTITPNPVRDHITVSINTVGQTYTVRILNILGRELIRATGSLNSINQQLNSQLWKLNDGLYILRADDADEHYLGLFIKQ